MRPRLLKVGISLKPAAALTIQNAKLDRYDPYDYLKGVLERLPTQKNSQIVELLPHRWVPDK